MKRQFIVEITMPSGEKLPPYPIDGDAYLLHGPRVVGEKLAWDIARLIEHRLKA